MNKKELKSLIEAFENFREVPGHLTLLKDLKKFPDTHDYCYCYACGNEESKHVYHLGKFHPADGWYSVCGKCFKKYYFMKEDEVEILKESTSVNLRVRFLVLERDGFKCVYCGRSPAKDNDVALHIDHVHPKSKGGSDLPENLVTACQECNLGKSDYILKKLSETKDF